MKGSRTVGGIEERAIQTGMRFRARVKVCGKVVSGPWRPTRAQAEADRQAMRTRRDTGGDELTIGEAMDDVVARLRRRQRRARTISDREQRFATLRQFFATDALLAEIQPVDVEAFADWRLKDVAAATMWADLRALSSCYALPKARHLPSPIKRADLPSQPRSSDIDWFRPEEMVELIDQVRGWDATSRLDPQRDADVIEFLALTGVRKSEMSQILVRDLRVGRKQLNIPEDVGKRGHRVINVSPDVIEIGKRLAEGKRPDDRLSPLSYGGLDSMLKRWAERLGESRLHAHALRHTFGTALAINGANERRIMAATGHRSSRTVSIYMHVAGTDAHETRSLSYRKPQPEPSDDDAPPPLRLVDPSPDRQANA